MKIPPYIALNLKIKIMTTSKLLGLLFEHIEAGDITSFEVYSDSILIYNHEESNYSTIKLNQDLLKQYNKIFNYE